MAGGPQSASMMALTQRCLISMSDLLSRLLMEFWEWIVSCKMEDKEAKYCDIKGGTWQASQSRVKGEQEQNRAESGPFYAVSKGTCPGIYRTWREAAEQVWDFSNPVHQRFSTKREAEEFMGVAPEEYQHRWFWSPSAVQCCWNFSLGRAFIRTLASCSCVEIYLTAISCKATLSLITWCCIPMCFILAWKTGL
jgi:hypothetical protein